ncbi:MAG: Ig-like domain-containing protein [Bacteroidota bacterium]|nr:Ig-like domain-containing protein [Bacteroidota bacterium]
MKQVFLLFLSLASFGFSFAQTSIFPSTSVPAIVADNDGTPIELGLKFRVTTAGYITGIRFYKGAANTGTHIGHLWSSTGTKLGEATFTGETASGWQQVLFATPVAVAINTTYVASYFSSAGYYADNTRYFTTATVNGPLRALADGEDGVNGVYIYTTASAFPVNSYQSSNYWVDIVYATTIGPDVTPPTVTSVSPVNNATGVAVSSPVSAIFSEALTASTVTNSTFQLKDAANNIIAATVTYNATTNTATLTPSAALSSSTVYTATITGGTSGVKDLAGNALASNFTWSFTTADIIPPTVSSVTPLNGATGVSVSTAVSAIFSEAMTASTISGTTFQLRNASNTLITATVTYNATTNTATLTPSAALSSSTVYTATITGGASGVKDLAGNALASNFTWSFTTADIIPPTVSSVSPVNGTTNVSPTTAVSAIFSEAMTASTISGTTFQLKDASNTLITATVTYNAATNTATLTPSASLAGSTVYTATITGGASGVKDLAGNALVNNFVWSFTTGVVDLTPPTVSSVSPANGATGVSLSTTVSAIFSEDMTASSISGTTFQLRDASNTLITATVTYNATSRTATLTPSAALAGSTVYTATITGGASGVKDLAGNALVNNFVWSFTTLTPDVTPPTVSSVTPVSGATGVSLSTTVTAIFSEAITASTISGTTFQLRNAANTLITATVTYNAATNTATLTPSAALVNSTVYTATITGGASGVKDLAGNAMVNNFVWSFTTLADVIPPTVTSVSPLSGATGVSVSTAVSAIFSEAMTASTISGTTFQLKNASNTLITATVTYNAATNTATLTPSAALVNSTVYTATITGGASGVKDAAGNALVNNFTWSFTTVSASAPTSTIFKLTDAPTTPLDNDGAPIELGVKFRTTQAGFITGIRFYKGAGNTGTHIGHLWSSTGTKLGEATFTGESASGWQQVLFTTPVPITTGVTYVASYFSPNGYYGYTNPYFTTAVTNGPLTALANGQDGGNGVYSYSATPAFPVSTFQTSNYWADVVFTTSAGPDTIPPTVLSVTPANGATGVSATSSLIGVFSEPVDATTINSSTVEVRDASNTLVPATITYTAATNTATLTPTSTLAYKAIYTAKIKGGAAGVKDVAGNALVADYTWTFTTSDPPPTEGPGGPILVVSTSTNPFSRYPVEILRAEGLNEFAAADISTVTATMLNNYDVVVLGEVTVTAAQVTMLTNWVNAGGTLIAFKPSSLLAPLCGLSAAGGTLADKYLLVNTASGPGVGIVNQTIQFHGTANLHTLNGATSLATLYSSATTATTNPAVTTINAGTGKVIAFTYDLAKSIVYTRQGNPAQAATETDGQTPIRPDDLFYPSYVDLNKVAIPQADEQQRLLANIIIQSNLNRKPLPRFWYMPNGYKAAVVYALDDHGTSSGTPDIFDKMIANSPAGCSLSNWECYRATSWFYVGIPLTNSQAVAYNSQGFEMGVHVQNGCGNFSSFADLDANYVNQLQQFQATYPGIPQQTTHRFHCLVWSDWLTQAKVELSHGMRLSLDYYYWPPTWVNGRPGMFTGSGMPMRFADTNGDMIDIYQGVSQLVNENGIDYAVDVNTVLDNALGAQGYYGFFGTHDDYRDVTFSNTVIASAKTRNVPIISVKQALTWLDARNSSSFGNMTWSNNQLTFSVTANSNANKIQAMLPFNAGTGQLISITLNGSSVAFTTQTIKGMQYAFFSPLTGTNTYVATYGVVGGRVASQPVVIAQPQQTSSPATAQTLPDAGKTTAQKAQEETSRVKLDVSVIPNPASSYFNLVIVTTEMNPVTVRVTDMFGRVIETHEKITTSGILRLGYTWAAGNYFAEVIEGDQRKVVKMIKVN